MRPKELASASAGIAFTHHLDSMFFSWHVNAVLNWVFVSRAFL